MSASQANDPAPDPLDDPSPPLREEGSLTPGAAGGLLLRQADGLPAAHSGQLVPAWELRVADFARHLSLAAGERTGRLWAEVPFPKAGAAWQDALRQPAGDVRGLVLRHPRVAPLLTTSRSVIPTHALEVMDAYLTLLQEWGMTEGRAAEIVRTLYAYALGFALIEVSWLVGDPADPADPAGGDDVHLIRRITRMVPAEAPDRLLRTAMLMCVECDMSAQFDLGTELMLRGLAPEGG